MFKMHFKAEIKILPEMLKIIFFREESLNSKENPSFTNPPTEGKRSFKLKELEQTDNNIHFVPAYLTVR